MPKVTKKRGGKPKRLKAIEEDIDSIEVILKRMYSEIEDVRRLLIHIAETKREQPFFGDK